MCVHGRINGGKYCGGVRLKRGPKALQIVGLIESKNMLSEVSLMVEVLSNSLNADSDFHDSSPKDIVTPY